MNIGFGGNLSGGKTNGIVYLMITEKNKDSSLRLCSNIKMYNVKYDFWPNEKFISFLKEVNTLPYEQRQKAYQDNFMNSFFLIDEIKNLLNAKKSTSSLNSLVLQFVMMCGKIDCNIGYTFQAFESQVDKELRGITDVIGECTRLDAVTKQPIIFGKRKYVDKNGNYKPILTKIELEFHLGSKIKKSTVIYDPSPYFKYFNTREIVILDRDKYLVSK